MNTFMDEVVKYIKKNNRLWTVQIIVDFILMAEIVLLVLIKH